jgi:putative ABC transport system permease protein
MLWVGAGLVVGLIAAAVAVRLLAATLDRMLFGQTAADPVIFASAAAMLLSVAAAAAYEPARKASRIDAQLALRYE